MKAIKIVLITKVLLTVITFTSCRKYLEEKPLKSQFVPENLTDLQALLDNSSSMNTTGPVLSEIVSDDYYISTASWQSLMAFSSDQGSNYIWSKNAIPFDNSWINVYQAPIYYANIVLDHLSKITVDDGNRNEYNRIKASALFYRAFAFFSLAQVYCKPYGSTANSDHGIVLRTSSDINQKSVRATVQETYDRIIADLQVAAEFLPVSVPFPTKPSKVAAFAALSRVYFSMRDYEKAEKFATSCLTLKNTLLNYNSLIPLQPVPVYRFNPEVIFHSVTELASILGADFAKIDSNLYLSYQTDDLRKIVFFKENEGNEAGTYHFIGSYNGQDGVNFVFDGLTTAEMYLTRAECYARAGNLNAAMSDLNVLMENRWKSNKWIPLSASNADQAKAIIMRERRKEMIYRGQRWSDLRRLNLEGENITLKRSIAGVLYTLPPNDPKWTMLIPYDVINRSGISQNDR